MVTPTFICFTYAAMAMALYRLKTGAAASGAAYASVFATMKRLWNERARARLLPTSPLAGTVVTCRYFTDLLKARFFARWCVLIACARAERLKRRSNAEGESKWDFAGTVGEPITPQELGEAGLDHSLIQTILTLDGVFNDVVGGIVTAGEGELRIDLADPRQ